MALAVDVVSQERNGLGNPQACSVASGQDGAMFAFRHPGEELQHPLGTEDDVVEVPLWVEAQLNRGNGERMRQ